MGRRANHEGTIRLRADGRWEGRIALAGHRYSVYGRTRREVTLGLRALLARHLEGALSPPVRMTVGEWLERYLASLEGKGRPATVRAYTLSLGRVREKLGHVRLSRLAPAHVAWCLEALRREGMGSRHVQMAHAHLHAALGEAVRMGLIGSNPVERVPRPGHQKRERPSWGGEEARRFLRAALSSPHRLAPLALFLLATGCRSGEALGLRWADIDLAQGRATIRRSLTRVGTQWHEGPPKSKAGERTLALPRMAIVALGRLPRPLSPDAPVFWTGAPPTPRALTHLMERLCRQAAVPYLPPHGLRHVHATLLAAEGLDVKTLQRRLGHSQASVTLDVYAHALSEMDKRAAEMVDKALDAQ
jgi:integrase